MAAEWKRLSKEIHPCSLATPAQMWSFGSLARGRKEKILWFLVQDILPLHGNDRHFVVLSSVQSSVQIKPKEWTYVQSQEGFGKSPDQEKSCLIQNSLFLLKKQRSKTFIITSQVLFFFFYTKEAFPKKRETTLRFFPSFLYSFPWEHHSQVTPSKEHT